MEAPDPVPSPLPAPEPGSPAPLGNTPGPGGTQFAVHAPRADRLTLALFRPGGSPAGEIALDARRHRTGDVWHVFVPALRPGAEYAWRVEGDETHVARLASDPRALLLDPYAAGVAGSERWAQRTRAPRRSVVLDLAYDWAGDRAPATPLERAVIYETHVRAFTAHASSGVRHPGTFAGLAEKARWLRELGVTAVQLMPVAEFDETDNPRRNPLNGQPLLNAWGYAPLSFLALRTAYAANATAAGAMQEFRDMVRALHAEGLEVILDVVFNHTGEHAGAAPVSWRGLDRAGYYLLDGRGRDIDHTGTGHTFACARPAASELILHALRFWASNMHVDGFRFDLASTLTRGEHGEPLGDPPLIRRIAEDPALAHVKLIAEPWDMGLYHVGRFPHHRRFAELNGRFRDDVRDWLRLKSPGPMTLADRLHGSPDVFRAGRSLGHSVNFLTSHDGFTLADLVSYERKHNEPNGERNRDGSNDNRSWNGGAEGPTHDPHVRAMRERQGRNAAALLLLSRGALLWLWGDESSRSQGGNNNAWCHDGPAWWLDWDAPARAPAFHAFVRGLMALRRAHPALAESAGSSATGGWNEPGERAHVAPRLIWRSRSDAGDEVMVLVNGDRRSSRCVIEPAPAGRAWHLVADTAAAPPADWTPLEQARPLADRHMLPIAERALVVLATR